LTGHKKQSGGHPPAYAGSKQRQHGIVGFADIKKQLLSVCPHTESNFFRKKRILAGIKEVCVEYSKH
jgi:hypothetical protein